MAAAVSTASAVKRYSVFGVTGECGKLFALYALEAGASLTVLVRDPKKLDAKLSGSDRVTVVTGDVTKPTDVKSTIPAGTSAVVSALGAEWNDNASVVRSVGIKNICDAMNELKVNRLLFIGGAGILSPKADPNAQLYQSATFPAAFKPLSEEHNKAYLTAKASGLAWTVVCPPTITKGSGNRTGAGKYLVQADHPAAPGMQYCNAENIADFILNEITANAFVGKRVSVMEPPKPKPAAPATGTGSVAAAKK